MTLLRRFLECYPAVAGRADCIAYYTHCKYFSEYVELSYVATKRRRVWHVLRRWCQYSILSTKCKKVTVYEVKVSLHRGRPFSWVRLLAEPAAFENTRNGAVLPASRLNVSTLMSMVWRKNPTCFTSSTNGKKRRKQSLQNFVPQYSERVQNWKA